MADQMEWRCLYAEKAPPGRPTLFVGGVAVGDYYHTSAGVFRVRLWPEDRLQGGRERLVLSEESARDTLLRMVERLRREVGE